MSGELLLGFKGLCMTVIYLVPTRKVAKLVPAPLKITEVAPGLTLGGIYAARYGKGGSGKADEFGVLPAYVGYEGRSGFFMHNYLSGEENPGCTEPASFNWATHGKWVSLDLAHGGSPVINVKMRPVFSHIPITASFSFLCVKGQNVVFFKNHYASNVGVSTSKIVIPDGSPIAGFPFGLKLISMFWDASNVVLKEPELVHERLLKAPEKALGTPIGKV
jgi:hypothetical protein